MRKALLTVTLIAFSVLTGMALWNHGFWGIIEPHFKSTAAAQVFVDLVIALSLFLCWMWRDARTTGRNPWPWLALILATGSIGALLYLICAPANKRNSPSMMS